MFTPFTTLAIGLILFLGGIYLFSRYAVRLASDEAKIQLRRWSNHTWPALLTGFFSTVLVQSSSLVSSLAVMLSGNKLITIRGGILLFLGANVGTTILDQLIVSPLLSFGPWIILIGIILYLLNWRHSRLASTVLFTIGLIFWGVALMSGALSGDGQLWGFEYLGYLTAHPWAMFGSGILLTALIQSSSASTGIMLAMVISGVVAPVAVIPFFLGADIGTTITENLASLMTGWPGKAVARASSLFSLVVGLIIMSQLNFFVGLIELVTPDYALPARLVANAHFGFNLLATLVALPFVSLLSRVARYLVKGSTINHSA